MTNLVILVGRIARDPETRTTTGGTTITSISVVTDRPARKDGKTYKTKTATPPRTANSTGSLASTALARTSPSTAPRASS